MAGSACRQVVSDNPSPGTAPDRPLKDVPARPRTNSPVAYGPTDPPDSALRTGRTTCPRTSSGASQGFGFPNWSHSEPAMSEGQGPAAKS